MFALIGILFLFIAKINTRGAQGSPEHMTTVNMYKDTVLFVDDIIGYPGITNYETIASISSMDDVNKIVQSPIPYIFKKDIMNRLMDNLKITILTSNKKAQEVTQEITKYGFIPCVLNESVFSGLYAIQSVLEDPLSATKIIYFRCVT